MRKVERSLVQERCHRAMVHPPAKFRHKLQFAEQATAMGSTWSAAVQGLAKRLWIGCVNAAAKDRKK